MTNSEKRKEALEWVNAGKPCKYRYGLAFRGAVAGAITTEKAKELIAKGIRRGAETYYTWNFGIGFNELCWEEDWNTHERYLMFNEYGENDLY